MAGGESNRIGYACLNGTLRDAGIKRRRLTKAQFEEGGLELAASVASHNLGVLAHMLLWNESHGIRLLRVTDIFPWQDKYEFEELPGWQQILTDMKQIGQYCSEKDHRITVHPSEFCVLASPNEESSANTLRELSQTARMLDHFGFDQSHFNKINIHIGGTYGCKEDTAARFIDRFGQLPRSARSRLTVENDDRINGWKTEELHASIYRRIQVPIVFDVFHHRCAPGSLSMTEALNLALSTWTTRPIIHMSSSKRDHEDPASNPVAHSRFIHDRIPDGDFDLMIEAKATEVAVLDVMQGIT